MSAQVISLQAYRLRRQTVAVIPRGRWTRIAIAGEFVELAPGQVRELAEAMNEALARPGVYAVCGVVIRAEDDGDSFSVELKERVVANAREWFVEVGLAVARRVVGLETKGVAK